MKATPSRRCRLPCDLQQKTVSRRKLFASFLVFFAAFGETWLVTCAQEEASISPPSVLLSPALLPPGPLKSSGRLTRGDILSHPQPLFLHSPVLLRRLVDLGVGDLKSLASSHGDEELSLLTGSRISGFLAQRRLSVRHYLEQLSGAKRIISLPDASGKAFFLERPLLYRDVAITYARLLPIGFREMLDVASRQSQSELKTAAERGDYGTSDFALQLTDRGHIEDLHVEFVTATLITVLEGIKRLWILPSSQADHLQLNIKADYEGWGRFSSATHLFKRRQTDLAEWHSKKGDEHNINIVNNIEISSERHGDAFPGLTPMVVDVKAGETIMIPCGWSYRAEHLETTMAILATVHPDWLDTLLKEKPTWQPNGCGIWFREPCGEDGCDWAEL